MVGPLALCFAAITSAQSVVSSVEAGESGVRFRCSGPVQSVSGRLDFRGRVVVTMVGQGLAPGVAHTFDQVDLAGIDGSGRLQGLTLEPTETSSGLSLVSAVLVPNAPVAFRVSVDGRDVVVDLEEPTQGAGAARAIGSRTTNRDPSSGRRVLTAADLEPIPGEPADRTGTTATTASIAPTASTGQRSNPEHALVVTMGRVNLRPEPTLDSVPLMTLPDATPLVGTERSGNWQRVQLGELVGWVDSSLIEVRAQAQAPSPDAGSNDSGFNTESDQDLASASDETLDLGEPGAWLERLSDAVGGSEAPSWDGLRGIDPALLSDREVANRERALQESTSRRLETAEQDLRQVRAESAELRIDLARANQQLEFALQQLDVASARVAELEALMPQIRSGAVESRAEMERSRATQQALASQLDESQRVRRRLESQASSLMADRLAARSEVEVLSIEADGLREALRRAEAEILVRADSAAGTEPENRPAGRLAIQLGAASAVQAATASEAVTEGAKQSAIASASMEMTVVDGALRNQVEAVLAGWAKSWSAQDMEQYAGFYSPGLETPLGGFGAWRNRRASRLQQPQWIEIEVDVSSLEVNTLGADEVWPSRLRVAFLQTYRAPDYQDVVQKVLVLVLEEGEWKIQREQAAEVLSMVASPQ